jgi:hypothetical protein
MKQAKQDLSEANEQEIKRLFHKLWSQSVGKEGYSKKDWQELQRLLQTRRIEV